MRKFWGKYKFVFLLFLIWRATLFVIGLVSFNLLRFNASFPYIREALLPTGLSQHIWHWANFDGVHYLMIAQFGYNGIVNNEQVFFPLFPILISSLTWLTHNYLISGLLISNFFALMSGLLIFKHFGKWATLFFYLFPTAFFLGSLYSESLFIFLVLLTFYKSKIFGILAGLTRLVGGAAGLLGIMGVAGYMLYLKLVFNNPLLFLFNQGGFNNGRASSLGGMITPFQTVFRYIKIFITADRTNVAYYISVLELSAFVFGVLVMGILTYRKKLSFWILIFGWSVLIIPSITGTLTSMPRYILAIFPIFAALGSLKSYKLKLAILGFFTIIQAVLTILFVRGYFVA